MIYLLLLLVIAAHMLLLARVSHWAHKTQARLETLNTTIADMNNRDQQRWQAGR